MKKSIILFIVLLLCFNLCAQSIIWGESIGGHTSDMPIDLDKTSNGVLLTTTTNNRIKGLHKYDSEGNLVWQFDLFESLPKGEYSDYEFIESEVDENDNIYVILNFNESTTEIGDITINYGVSLLKISSEGNVLWSQKIADQISVTDMSLMYSNGNVYLLGNFLKTANINDKITLTSKQYWDCYSRIYRYGMDYYLAKFDIEGNLSKVVSFGSEYHDYVASATIDENSNIYFTGGSEFHTCTTRYTHITKYNSDLELQWEKVISKEENNSQLIYPSNIYYSKLSNKLYLWGYNLLGVIHDEYQIPASPCSSYSSGVGAGANLMEFTVNEGKFIKYRHFANCTSNSVWQVGGTYERITTNKAGIVEVEDSLIILSSIHGSMEFDNGQFESTYVISQYNEKIWDENLFLMKVNKENFNSEFIEKFYGDRVYENGPSIDNPFKIILEDNNIYLSAFFECSPINVFDTTIVNNSGNNDSDILISKINLSNTLSINENVTLSKFKIYPNPAKHNVIITNPNDFIKYVKVYSITGSLVQTNIANSNDININISDLSNGLYFFNIKTNNGTSTKKVLINR
ncbi:T9SS type A sorting domain-containing protein [Tenacibaculum sp. 190524A05c]|uniref:T9SS type A sorting domain-containing protein n=1 Tax=Tenacibaculum platacis TaxID=3137852 RepID=UPI0032B2E914